MASSLTQTRNIYAQSTVAGVAESAAESIFIQHHPQAAWPSTPGSLGSKAPSLAWT